MFGHGRTGLKDQFETRLLPSHFPGVPTRRVQHLVPGAARLHCICMRRSSGESADADGETWGDLLVFWSLWRFDLLARDGREGRVGCLEKKEALFFCSG